jgi:transcriptional regulator with XRE-family HTH domain
VNQQRSTRTRIDTYNTKRRRIAIQQGTWRPWADREQVLAHLQRLLDAGMTKELIAQAAGLPRGTIRMLPERARIETATAHAVLAVQPGATARDAVTRVPALGTIRRIHALSRIGWPQNLIAQRAGVAYVTVTQIAGGKHNRVAASTAEKIRRAYDELSGTPGPDKHVMSKAIRKNWAPPAAWDDNIDDPAATPQTGTRRAVMTAEEQIAEVEHLMNQGCDIDYIAEALNRNRRSIEQNLRRYKRNDLLDRLINRAA